VRLLGPLRSVSQVESSSSPKGLTRRMPGVPFRSPDILSGAATPRVLASGGNIAYRCQNPGGCGAAENVRRSERDAGHPSGQPFWRLASVRDISTWLTERSGPSRRTFLSCPFGPTRVTVCSRRSERDAGHPSGQPFWRARTLDRGYRRAAAYPYVAARTATLSKISPRSSPSMATETLSPWETRRISASSGDIWIYGDRVSVAIEGDERGLIFDNVAVRVSPDMRLEMHIVLWARRCSLETISSTMRCKTAPFIAGLPAGQRPAALRSSVMPTVQRCSASTPRCASCSLTCRCWAS
jgi:hypothetical protein